MAMLERLPADTVTAPRGRGFAEFAVTAFFAVLAVAALAPSAVTAILGVVLLAGGLLLASVLFLRRLPLSKPSLAWDLAAVATFLGFVATLVSDANVLPL